MTTRGAIYCRISSDNEGLALGVKRQEEDLLALAAAHDLDVVEVLVENDTGASTRSRKPRPEYERMKVMVANRQVDAIIFYSNSRLTRRPLELEDWITLHEQTGVRLLSKVSGQDDLSTADGRMVARIKASVDAAEAERISERVMRKQQQLRDQGKPFGGGKRPYGYDASRRTVIEVEAKVIRRIASDILAGVPTGTIARRLNEQGVPSASMTDVAEALARGETPTRKPSPWSRTTVRAVVTKPRLWGDLTFKGDYYGKGNWPTILDAATGERLLAVLNDPARKSVEQDGKRRHLLSGIARCGVCKEGMYLAYARGEAMGPRYKCLKACVAVNQAHLDRYVMDRVLRRVPVEDTGDPEQERELRQKIDQLRLAQDRVLRQLENALISESEFAASRLRTNSAIAEAEAEFADVATRQPLAPDLLIENAGELNLVDRRRLVEQYVIELTVKKSQRRGRGFDEDRITLVLSGREIEYEVMDDQPGEDWATLRAVSKKAAEA